MEVLSLYELNRLIRSVIEGSLPDTFLVTAEIASCDVKNHCYITLVDKEEDTIRAEIRAVIWANRYKVIAPVFEKSTGTKLAKGIKILFQSTVNFHERYGLKLTITDIDPSYTIGELAVRRKDILEKLTKEGLIDKNKELEFPLVPQRIGIISSSTAAGYEDLMAHLVNNTYGYKLQTKLYEAIMQGDRAGDSIVNALNQCAGDSLLLDIVVIVRGGGGQTDLHCFDSYDIGKAIALLPLPVVSGIGHQRDVTVVDEVSSMRSKTPTAVADMIITRIKDFEDRIDSSAYNLVQGAGKLTSDMRDALSLLAKRHEVTARDELSKNFHLVGAYIKGLGYSLKVLRNERQRMKLMESSISHLNPRNVLKRGYSITYKNGESVKSVSGIKKGDIIKTVLYDGELTSKVETKSRSRKKQ